MCYHVEGTNACSFLRVTYVAYMQTNRKISHLQEMPKAKISLFAINKNMCDSFGYIMTRGLL